MIEFVTIGTITSNVLNIIRSSHIVQSEPISKRRIEGLIHQNRALLLKRDIDKNKLVNPDYIQQIQALELEEVDESEGTTLENDMKIFRTKEQIPNTIDFNNTSGFTYVGTINGRELQFSSESKSRWQQYSKYTSNDDIVFLKNGYLYLISKESLRYLTVRGIFEIPTEVSRLNNPNESIEDTNENSYYPIPINMVPALTELILKELGIELKMPSDKDNDSDHKLESNVKQ